MLAFIPRKGVLAILFWNCLVLSARPAAAACSRKPLPQLVLASPEPANDQVICKTINCYPAKRLLSFLACAVCRNADRNSENSRQTLICVQTVYACHSSTEWGHCSAGTANKTNILPAWALPLPPPLPFIPIFGGRTFCFGGAANLPRGNHSNNMRRCKPSSSFQQRAKAMLKQTFLTLVT